MTDLVHIVTPEGQVKSGPAADLPDAIAAGAREATPQEVQKADDAKRYGGVGGAKRAWMNAGIQGATAGLGLAVIKKGLDAISPELGHKYAEDIEGLKREHPTLSTTGEIGGMLAATAAGSAAGPAAAAGRVGGLARLLPTAAIDATGTAVEGGVARGLAGLAERGVAGRAASAAASLGARGAIEGAAWSAANQISEDMLGDHELAADKLYLAAGKGALFGGAAGAAFGAGGSLLSSGARGLGRLAFGSVGGGLTKAERGAVATAEGVTAADAAQTAGVNLGQEGLAARSIPAKVAGWDIGEKAGAVAFDALGGGKPAIKAAARAGGASAVGRQLFDDGIIDGSKGVIEAFKNGRPDEILARITPARELHGARIGEIIASTPASVRFGELASTVDAAAKPYRMAGGEGIIAKLEAYKTSLAHHLGALAEDGVIDNAKMVSAADVINQRRFLDDLIYNEKGLNHASLAAKAFEGMRNGIEDAALSGIDAAAKALGKGELRAELEAEKLAYMRLTIAERAATEGATRVAGNRTFGLSDTLGFVAGMAGGGGPLGGMAMGVANKMLRERGSAATAVLLDRMASVGAMKRAMAWVDEQMNRGAKGVLEGGVLDATAAKMRKANKAPPRDYLPLRARYKEARERVEEMQADPEGYSRRMAAAPGAAANFAPNVSAAYVRNLQRAAAFLVGKLPPTLDPGGPIGTNDFDMPSDPDASKFLRYYEAVDHPASVLHKFADGSVTPEEAEALKATAPEAFTDLQGRVIALMAHQRAKGKLPPFEVRQRLYYLLDVTTDASQRPEIQKLLQANVTGPAAQSQQGSAPPPGKAHRPVKLSTQPSALDRLEASGPGRK